MVINKLRTECQLCTHSNEYLPLPIFRVSTCTYSRRL